VSLVGQGAVGKSLLIFEIAMALATGRSVLGYPPADPIRVLYIDMENPVSEAYKRRLDLGYGEDSLEGLTYYHMPNLPTLDTQAGGKFIEALAERHSAELLILDTISKLVEGEESKADTWQDLYKYSMIPLRERTAPCSSSTTRATTTHAVHGGLPRSGTTLTFSGFRNDRAT
jgi:AAA domain